MPKIYKAQYKDSDNRVNRHHGASLVKVEKEARQKAVEIGQKVTVSVLNLEKLSTAYLIQLMNHEKPINQTVVSVFEPTKRTSTIDEDGTRIRWKVKRIAKE